LFVLYTVAGNKHVYIYIHMHENKRDEIKSPRTGWALYDTNGWQQFSVDGTNCAKLPKCTRHNR